MRVEGKMERNEYEIIILENKEDKKSWSKERLKAFRQHFLYYYLSFKNKKLDYI